MEKGIDKLVVVDIDGTLGEKTLCSLWGRVPDTELLYLIKNLEPNPEVLPFVKEACQEVGTQVVIITARDERYREATKMWLTSIALPSDNVYMRPSNYSYDRKVTAKWKGEVFKNLLQRYSPKAVLLMEDSIDNIYAMNSITLERKIPMFLYACGDALSTLLIQDRLINILRNED